MAFEYFDEIRIINLVHRKDRRASMCRELSRIGLGNDRRVQFFEALSFADAGAFSSRGARGVFQSQLAILEEAAQRGHSVLILEDDVDFADEARDYALPRNWAIFYGGYYAKTPNDLQTSDIVGAHMMGFSAEIVPKVAAYLRSINCTGIHPPIDGAYVWFRRANPEVVTLFAKRPLGNQRPSRSDIANLHFYDRLPGLMQSASAARLVKRFLGNINRRTSPN